MDNRKRRRPRPGPAIIFLGFSSRIVSCQSLTIDLATHNILRLNQLHQRGRQPPNLPYSRETLLTAFAKPDLGDDYDGEEQQNESSQPPTKESSTSRHDRERRDHYFSMLRTAIAAFCAGSFGAVLLSVILFRYTLMSDYDPNASFSSYPTNVGSASNPSSSFREKNNPTDDANQQKQKAVVLYRSILEQLNENYVDELPDPMLLFQTSIRAMLSTLDPYTEYISPQSVMQRRQQVGIGAFVMKSGNNAQELLDGKSVSTVVSLIPSAITLPTQLLPPDQDNNMRHHLQESQNDRGFQVVLSLEGYAYDAGLRVGDEILEIDDQPVVGDTSLERVRELLLGVPGTKVKLAFKRPGIEHMKSIYVERNVVQFPNVPYAGVLNNDRTLSTKDGVLDDVTGSIGYIKLRRFGLDAGVSMEKAIESIQSDNMKGLILDLRDNSGGELLAAVQIATQFFPNDTYLGSSEGKDFLYPNESYRSGKLDLAQYGYASSDKDFSKRRNTMSPGGDDGIFKDGKQIIDPDKTRIIILTNQRTASASEFLAGAFQDLDKGVIIGNEKSTLGKGIGQREMGLPNGGALKLTYHEFHTPSGRCVQRQYQSGKENQPKELFYTKNGRAVNDRKGIEVDYRAEPKVSLLSPLLSSSGAYFKFATQFCESRGWPPNDKNGFVVDDRIYNDFKSFVLREQRGGNLKLEEVFDDEHLLEKIQTLSVDSNLHGSNRIQSSVSNLQEKIVEDLLGELFDDSSAIIRNDLEQNILARKLPDSRLISRSLESDELVREAVQIIEDVEWNKKLLGKSI